MCHNLYTIKVDIYSFIHFYLVTRYSPIHTYIHSFTAMKQEITVALDLLCSYIERFGSIKVESITQFRDELEKVLTKRYEGHWYPGKLDCG